MNRRPADLPTPPGSFDAPWRLRSYALVAGLTGSGRLDADTFRRHVEDAEAPVGGDEVRELDEGRRWVAALERALLEEGALDPTELDAAVRTQRSAAATDDHGRSTHVARFDPVGTDPGRSGADVPSPWHDRAGVDQEE